MIKTGIYRHYKGSDEYRIIGPACHTETGEKMVVYQSLSEKPDLTAEYGPNPYFVRPYEMFLETVEREGQTVPRFEWVREG